jgi:hypothetical protein
MFQSEIVAAVFQFINFGALIGAAYYFFYTKFLGPVKDQMKEKEVFLSNLQKNRESLIAQQEKLNKEITWQDNYAHELMEKISYWHEATESQQAARIKEGESNANKAQERVKKQAEYYQIRLKTKKIIPMAFNQAQKELEKIYSNHILEKEYVEKSINKLRESVS